MITFPLYIILLVYLTYILIIGWFAYINLSHLFRNDALTATSFLVTLLLAIFIAVTLFFTIASLSEVDWTQPITLWNNDWISNILTPSNF